MFKRQEKVKEKGTFSTDYKKLLTDSFFINNNIKKLDFIYGSMISKNTLNGRVYVANMQVSLSEIKDLNSFLNDFDLIDMIYLYTENEEVQVYEYDYVSHFISASYIEVTFKNGKTKKLNF